MRPFHALAAAILVAGCTQAGTGPVEDAPRAATVLWQGTGCEQLHGIFASPADDWGQPEGWTPQTDDGGVTDRVYVYPTTCAEGTEAWVLVGITPPADLADPDVELEYWVLTAAVSDLVLRDALVALGFPVVEGTAAVVPQPVGEIWTVEKQASSYGLVAATGAPTGDDFHVTQRFWTMGADGPVALRMEVMHAADQGTGSVTFTAQGDDGAPPVLPGLAHRITDLSFTYAVEKHPADAQQRAVPIPRPT